MSQERASERFHRLVYSHMMATSESRDKAWSIVAENHKALYSEYQAETVAEDAKVQAANEAEEARKTKAGNARRARLEAVTDAVAAVRKEAPWMEYNDAYAKVQREQPQLFAVLQEPASLQAANATPAKPSGSGGWELADLGRRPDATGRVHNG